MKLLTLLIALTLPLFAADRPLDYRPPQRSVHQRCIDREPAEIAAFRKWLSESRTPNPKVIRIPDKTIHIPDRKNPATRIVIREQRRQWQIVDKLFNKPAQR